MTQRMLEAKEKAERFLCQIIDNNWDEALKNTESKRYYDDLGEWPLRLEAQAYLGRKYKERIPDFAREVVALWQKWIRFKEEQRSIEPKLFWELHDTFRRDEAPKADASGSKEELSGGAGTSSSSYPEVSIDLLVSICRAKEALGIEGYDDSIDYAAKKVFTWLMVNDVFSHGNRQIVWQVCRSPYLKNSYKEYIVSYLAPAVLRRIAQEESDYHERIESGGGGLAEKLIDLEVSFWAEVGFFCSFVNLGYGDNPTIKKFALNLYEAQEPDGSLLFDTVSTCLAMSYIVSCMPKTPTRGSFIERAVGFLLETQNRDGSWSSSMPWDEFDETKPKLVDTSLPTSQQSALYKTMGDKVQTTVIVLEALDLSLGLGPAPAWTIGGPVIKEIQATGIGKGPVLPVPSGTKWPQVTIECINEEQVLIAVAGNSFGVHCYIALGFRDEKTKRPNKLWTLLLRFGAHKGTIGWKTPGQKVTEKDVSRLRIKLRDVFNLADDPLPYFAKRKVYEARFKVTYKDATEAQEASASSIEGFLAEEQADKYRKGRRAIEDTYAREISGRNEDDLDS